jgi:2-iminobutanoate/2-iminopropanoate deaminase
METISTRTAPLPAGHYSQAIVQGELVYVSGQLPIDPHTGEKCTGNIEVETRQALQNLVAILMAANSSVDLVIKTTVYIADIELWDRVNGVYAEFFADHRPARAVVPTRELHFGCRVEIDAIAVVEPE